jgi:hypothetical protein
VPASDEVDVAWGGDVATTPVGGGTGGGAGGWFTTVTLVSGRVGLRASRVSLTAFETAET